MIARLVDAPSRDSVRQAATSVFGADDLQRHRSLWERFVEWLQKLIGANVPKGQGSGVPSPNGFSALSEVLAWLLVVVAAALMLWCVYSVLRSWSKRSKVLTDDTDTEVVDERTTAEWRADADRLERDGEWKDALRARYRELVGELVDRRVLSPQAGRTTGEFRSDVSEVAPQVIDSFDAASRLFELAWYGRIETGSAENAQFRELAADVLARATTVRQLASVGTDAEAWMDS